MLNRYINRLFVAMILSLSLTVVSCGSDSDDEGSFTAKAQKEAISNISTSWFINIDTPGEWIATIEFPDDIGENGEANSSRAEAWAWLQYTNGTGKTTLGVGADRNTTDVDRHAIVVITSLGRTLEVNITQLCFDNASGGGNDGGGEIDPGKAPKWMELPAMPSSTGNKFIAHHFDLDGKSVRNFSMFYDPTQKIAYWVAYPMHSMYIGSVDRTNAWGYDPSIGIEYQANLSRSYVESNLDRGHQVASADRTITREANKQTFYYTNMTPQEAQFNQRAWGNLEAWVRTRRADCDTLYIVTGAILHTTSGNESVSYAHDRSENLIATPNYYFKVLLQRRIATDEYLSLGFWYENKNLYGNEQPSASRAKSVEDIEKLTGMTFFTNLPDQVKESVKKQFEPSEWKL